MNDKGQGSIGIMLVAAIAILVGLAIFSGAILPNIGTATRTEISMTNTSYTMAASNSTVEITHCGQKILSGLVYNRSSGVLLTTTNYSFVQFVGADGLVAAGVKTLEESGYASSPINVTCVSYEPDGYVESSGGRSIVLLVAIFSALAIAVVALVPTLRSGVLEMMGR